MIDQAAALRDLVRRCEHEEGSPATRRLPRVLFIGGKGGVGTTTSAVHATCALRSAGRRPLLIDADLYRADTALLCGLDPARAKDPHAPRQSLRESIQIGAGGIRLLPNLWPPGRPLTLTESSWRRRNEQIDALWPQTDLAVLDAGGSHGEMRRKLWRAAQLVVLVTRPDDLSVMDAYATIKSMHQAGLVPPSQTLCLLVNLVQGADQAADVFGRIDRSCRRFLDVILKWLGHVERAEALERPIPKAAGTEPETPFAAIAARLLEWLPSIGRESPRVESTADATLEGAPQDAVPSALRDTTGEAA